MRTKQWRKLEELRVYNRHVRDNPHFYQKHKFKTPGKPCSGPVCCGNPRRNGHLTIQEQKFLAANDDLETQVYEHFCMAKEDWLSAYDSGMFECEHGLSCQECHPPKDLIDCEGPINKIKMA
jgi:hypothetical protein